MIAPRVRIVAAGAFTADADDAISLHPAENRAERMRPVGYPSNPRLPQASPGSAFVEFLQLVEVLAFGVVEFAKQSSVCQSLHEHVGLHVVAVLRQHVRGPRMCAGDYQVSALLDENCRGDLTQYMNATFQRHDRLRSVEVHGGANDDRVQLRGVQHLLVRGVLFGLPSHLRGLGERFLAHIAQRVNPRSFVRLYRSVEAPATPKSDDANVEFAQAILTHPNSLALG